MAPRKKKRPPSRQAALPPKPRRAPRAAKRPGAARAAVVPPQPPAAPPARALHYKVVELSTVDEGTLERTVNDWCAQGWTLDVVQFAMRESSKRPAMAFVFFTREGAPAAQDESAARGRLREIAETGSPSARLVSSPDFTGNAAVSPSIPAAASDDSRYTRPAGMVSAHERLAQLAGLDTPERPERGLVLEPGPEPDLVLMPGPGNNMEPVPGSAPGFTSKLVSELVSETEQEFEFDPGDDPEPQS